MVCSLSCFFTTRECVVSSFHSRNILYKCGFHWRSDKYSEHILGLEIMARHQTMSGHILKCLAEINFASAIEQTYDWTNYFKHKIIFCKLFPVVKFSTKVFILSEVSSCFYMTTSFTLSTRIIYIYISDDRSSAWLILFKHFVLINLHKQWKINVM